MVDEVQFEKNIQLFRQILEPVLCTKLHIIAFLGAITFSCCAFQAFGRCGLTKCIRPPFLHRGDTVAIVATSYEPADSIVIKSSHLLRSWGFEPVVAPNITENPIPDSKDSVRYYAGDVLQRAESLEWALENRSIKALICARGGYGAIHLLEHIPMKAFRKHPKWLVGYSDVTTLNCALASGGIMSIHGQMGVSFCEKGSPDEGAFKLRDLLLGEIPRYEIQPDIYNSCGKAEGVLVGGNMITMAALLGTEFDPTDHKGVILFIEEIGESMHAIDRLFNMLILHDRLKNVRGIVFGAFEECDRDLPYGSVEHMLYQYTSKLGIPVCYGFPAGHGEENMPILEGARVVLDVTDQKVELSFKL